MKTSPLISNIAQLPASVPTAACGPPRVTAGSPPPAPTALLHRHSLPRAHGVNGPISRGKPFLVFCLVVDMFLLHRRNRQTVSGSHRDCDRELSVRGEGTPPPLGARASPWAQSSSPALRGAAVLLPRGSHASHRVRFCHCEWDPFSFVFSDWLLLIYRITNNFCNFI